MSYFFPSIIGNPKEFKDVIPAPMYTVSSGEHAIQILIRSQAFTKGSKIALPAFVCGSVARAIFAEGHTPIYLDLKDDGRFVTDYNFQILNNEKPVAVILVHLYGVLHDNNKAIENYCIANNIYLIQDLAQSFGLNEDLMNPIFPKVYSFGPGKSATAAGGAMIRWANKEQSLFNLKNPGLIANIKAKLFLKSRIYGQEKSFMDVFLQKLIDKYFSHDTNITQMSAYQKKAATYVISRQKSVLEERLKRWKKIDEVILAHTYLKSAMPNNFCLGFKYVIFAHQHAKSFERYLKKHHIPYYCLGSDIINEINANLPNFKVSATSFIEISCEAVIPMQEIERITPLLKAFKP
jgi:hypothetical protein